MARSKLSSAKRAALNKVTHAAQRKRRASTELQSPRKRLATQSTQIIGEDDSSSDDFFNDAAKLPIE
jgi:hypothetical protein